MPTTPGSFEHVTTAAGLDRLVRRLADEAHVAFDTEFVSEHTYRSQLCLLQVAAPGTLAVVDTLAVRELDPFWELCLDPERTVVVHAGREEMGFILHAVGQPPPRLFDVQVAAGIVDHEYPAGYGALVRRLLSVQTNKGETRTDWRKRPLSQAQLDYALDDVRHLEAMWQRLEERLERLGRRVWMDEEMATWQEDVAESFTRKRWRRISGLNGLSRRELAVARELWHWRDAVAEERDMPPKRVLRDDLLVELCKRKSADPTGIAAIRGMQRSDLRHIMKGLCAAVDRGLALPDEECPGGERFQAPPAQLAVIGQFLVTAINGLCRQVSIAPALVGTAGDMRELLSWKLGYYDGDRPPLLATGWRAEVVGDLVDDLLAGRAGLRIADVTASDPLVIERFAGAVSSPPIPPPPRDDASRRRPRRGRRRGPPRPDDAADVPCDRRPPDAPPEDRAAAAAAAARQRAEQERARREQAAREEAEFGFGPPG
ncbi:MAG: ribonuclease D [Planctomycetes bacterium]|nr:ribonuclease D [Planctomycetota bacterium]MBM4056867.1 ribonuclease D [Planctomycetota bacterium]